MKINRPVPTHFGVNEARSGSLRLAGSYKMGQLLEATVLANSSNGQVRLRLGDSEVTASTAVSLTKNTRLVLKVIQLQPRLLLRVMPSSDDNALHAAIKNLLPRQASLAPLLAELAFKTRYKQDSSNPSPLRAAAHLLLAALPDRTTIKQADGLQRALMQSGLLLEAKLANSTTQQAAGLATDLKSLLLRCLNTMQQSQPGVTANETTQRQTGLRQQGGQRPQSQPGRQPIAQPEPATRALNPNSASFNRLQGELTRPALLPANHNNAINRVTAQLTQQQNRQPSLDSDPRQTIDQPRAAHNRPASIQPAETPGARLFQSLQDALTSRPGPLQTSGSRHFAAVAEQAELKPQHSDTPPPLRGQLPCNQPRALHDASAFTTDNQLNSPAMLKALQGALARLSLLQVATAENFEDGQHLWQLEIPVRQGDAVEIVSLTIEKEQKNASQQASQDSNWIVNLSLDLPQLGPLQTRISMDRAGLSTTFWSESAETIALIESRLSALRANLAQHGLETHNLSCRTGQQTSSPSPRSDSPLLDYRI